MNLDEITVSVNVTADGVDEGMSAAAESVSGFSKTAEGASSCAVADCAAIAEKL